MYQVQSTLVNKVNEKTKNKEASFRTFQIDKLRRKEGN